MFISRDSYFVDNHYAFGKANPITFIDPTGHNATLAVNYTIGSSITALGILGVFLAIPTGGASLTLSESAGIAAGVTASLSGISLVGSQVALYAENKKAATALQYSTLALTLLTMIEVGANIAPYISARFFSAPTSVSASVSVSGSLESTASSPWNSNFSAINDVSVSSIFSYNAPIDSSLSSSASRSAIDIGVNEAGETTLRYITSGNRTIRAPLARSESISSIEAEQLTTNPFSESAISLDSAPASSQTSAAVISKPDLPTNYPITSNNFGRVRPAYFDITDANATANQSFTNDLSSTEFLQSLDLSSFEEAFANDLSEKRI
jgi:hypothetical protein